jgi:hypothetical protein
MGAETISQSSLPAIRSRRFDEDKARSSPFEKRSHLFYTPDQIYQRLILSSSTDRCRFFLQSSLTLEQHLLHSTAKLIFRGLLDGH